MQYIFFDVSKEGGFFFSRSEGVINYNLEISDMLKIGLIIHASSHSLSAIK